MSGGSHPPGAASSVGTQPSIPSPPERVLRIGAAGLGRAFTIMLPTFQRDPRVRLVAAADPRPEARRRFEHEFAGPAYASVEALCADGDVDVVYIATPHELHATHAVAAARAGKHALIEKPIAIRVDEARAMIDAFDASATLLVVGHSHSFDRPILHARALVDRGTFGTVRMIHAANFTDFMYRPRRPEELVTEQGGGVLFSQAAHQVDIVRLLAGARACTVRAHAGRWDPSRPSEGAYSALVGFDHGAWASLTYSGYAHFDSDELMHDIGELGFTKDWTHYGAARKALTAAQDGVEETALKNARNYGAVGSPTGASAQPVAHQHFGFVLVSCERGDLRPLPDGVAIYADERAWFEPLEPPVIPRVEVIDELCDAVVHGRRALHDGRSALATLEICLAMLASAREGREVALVHQVGVGFRP